HRRAAVGRLPALLPGGGGRQGRRDGAAARARGGDGGLLARAPSLGGGGDVPRGGQAARERARAAGAPGPLTRRRGARRHMREGGRLIGLMPLFAETIRLGGVRVRRVAFIGDGETGCDYLDALAEPGREREVLERCLDALLEMEWDLCDLDDLWRESFTAGQLAARFPPN